MKKYLITARVYDTGGFLPDIFGETQQVVIEAKDLPTARGMAYKQAESMLSHVSIKSVEEITP